jgi:hypothetical protein
MAWAFSKVPPLCLSALDQAPHIDSVHRLFGDLTRAKVKVMNEITARLRSSTRASLRKRTKICMSAARILYACAAVGPASCAAVGKPADRNSADTPVGCKR